MRKVDAFLFAMNKATQDIFLCTREKAIAPVQRSNLALLFKLEKEILETYANDIKTLFSNHLALNFSFVASENIQAIDEKNIQLDFECISKLRKLIASNKIIENHFIEGAVNYYYELSRANNSQNHLERCLQFI